MHHRFKLVFCCLMTVSPLLWAAGFMEREISFSTQEVQEALAKTSSSEKNYGGLVSVALPAPPQVTLGEPAGLAGVTARLNISLLGSPAIGVDVAGTAGIRYDDKRKAFFLENPVAHSIQSPALSRDSEPMAKQAINAFISNYFRNKPVYVLREDGKPEEIAARWLLKSVRIEPGRVVATLAPF
ncbi:DUF1439 domain-containing protein [Dechloromonas denitrificans]|uniref:DUF1439 domain-containing protein n=1 Tax=Dechloromonas denitrificans TaxID=281362 RepID=UPI001CF92B3C|nr:DUF1439 domain-containing protein [Dechloromonas denitrificans]UCV11309.1 DUF1439 domain-containing protein [Dechloromonas denitrificans]